MMTSTLRACALPIFVFAVSHQSYAESLTFFFSGAVSDVPAELAGEFSINDPIVGNYTFDTMATDTLPGDASRGNYIMAVSSFDMTIGSYQLTSNGLGDIAVEDNLAGKDTYTVVSFATGDSLGGIEPSLMALQLMDSNASVFSNDALPLTPPDPSQFDDPLITIDFSGATLVRLEGTLDTFQVPEPTAGWTLLMASGVLLLRKRFRRILP